MNNDLIFYQILSTACNKLVLMPSIPRNSERDWSIRLDSLHTLLCRSICPSFVDFVLLFSFHYEMATEATVYVHFLHEREWQLNMKNMKISKIS